MEVISCVVHKDGFLREVAQVIALGLRRATGYLYQGKWCRFFSSGVVEGISLSAGPPLRR